MKVELTNIPGSLTDDVSSQISRRLEGVLKRTDATEAQFRIERPVRGGKAGVTVDKFDKTIRGLRVSVQCGKGGMRLRGILSTPNIHPLKLHSLLAEAPDITVQGVTKRKKKPVLQKALATAAAASVAAAAPAGNGIGKSSPTGKLPDFKDPEVLLRVMSALGKLAQPIPSQSVIDAVAAEFALKTPKGHLAFLFRLLKVRNIIKPGTEPKTYILGHTQPQPAASDQVAPSSTVSPWDAGSELMRKVGALENAAKETATLRGEIADLRSIITAKETRIKQLQPQVTSYDKLHRELKLLKAE